MNKSKFPQSWLYLLQNGGEAQKHGSFRAKQGFTLQGAFRLILANYKKKSKLNKRNS